MKHIDSNSEYEKMIKEDKLTVLDFFAEWCGPCKMLGPVFEELAHSFEGNDHVQMAKVNVDENNDIAAANGVSSIPTIVFYKDGKEVKRHVGYIDKDSLKSLIEQTI